MNRNSFGNAANPGAAAMETDAESGNEGESNEKARFALTAMFQRGLIPEAIYRQRLADLDQPSLTARIDNLPLAQIFRIARDARHDIDVVTLMLAVDGITGIAECRPYARYGESPAQMVAALEGLAEKWQNLPADQRHPAIIQDWLPAGAARNALDCALWDWLARRQGKNLAACLGIDLPAAITTAVTISLDEPAIMARAAAEKADWPLLKLKLSGGGDAERLRAVRHAAPNARLIVDANEAWSLDDYHFLMPLCAELAVALVEQPFAEGQDDCLAGLPRPVPVAADESCHDRAGLARLQGLYDVVNIKLDKTGGLTEALALKQAARAAGFGVMIGCMVGSSRAIAPALVLAGDADFVDLDGPLWLAQDIVPGLVFERGMITPPAHLD